MYMTGNKLYGQEQSPCIVAKIERTSPSPKDMRQLVILILSVAMFVIAKTF